MMFQTARPNGVVGDELVFEAILDTLDLSKYEFHGCKSRTI